MEAEVSSYPDLYYIVHLKRKRKRFEGRESERKRRCPSHVIVFAQFSTFSLKRFSNGPIYFNSSEAFVRTQSLKVPNHEHR